MTWGCGHARHLRHMLESPSSPSDIAGSLMYFLRSMVGREKVLLEVPTGVFCENVDPRCAHAGWPYTRPSRAHHLTWTEPRRRKRDYREGSIQLEGYFGSAMKGGLGCYDSLLVRWGPRHEV